MEKRELKTWWDLTEDEQEDFRQYIVKHNVLGWEELKEACEVNGFEADEDMPTIYDLKEDANVSGRQVTGC